MRSSPAITRPGEPLAELSHKRITIALAGQPNVGKSTVFNLLTGLNQHVGNWPGKTVEYKVGSYLHHGIAIEIVDLPGTYSLSANSLEERIARDFIIKEHPDVVVVILNASALERNLYLVTELLWLGVPMVLGLNMVDVAKQQGIQIESHVLEAALGLPVVPMMAPKNQGVRELMAAVENLICDLSSFKPNMPTIREEQQAVVNKLKQLISGLVPEPYLEDWVALKLLEGDEEITRIMQEHLADEQWTPIDHILSQNEDAVLAIASGRYAWIGRMMRAAVINPPRGQISLTDRLDRIATHPYLGLLLLIGIFGLIFWITFSLASPVQTWLDNVVINGSAEWIRQTLKGSPTWLSGLLADGVIAGAGTVLTLLPILVVFFSALSLLENIGYMSRAAYVMDRFMHPMGLHGKSCLPLLIGFGCNVPSVMGARIIEGERGRILTILVAPLVPCAARLAVLAFLTPLFFPGNPIFVSWGLVALNLIVLAMVGLAANRLLFHSEHMAFIMELPLYHLPNIRTIAMDVWQRCLAFLHNAGTLILLVSIAVWILASIPGPSIEDSILAGLGHRLEPLGKLMGLDWRMMVALLTSFLAKENTIATLGILFHNGNGMMTSTQSMISQIPPISALSFLVVQMLFVPCAATVAVMYKELKSWRWVFVSIGLLLVISFGFGIAIYQGSLLYNFIIHTLTA